MPWSFRFRTRFPRPGRRARRSCRPRAHRAWCPATACSSLCTVSLSLLTAALADARLASRVAVLMVAFDEEELEPELAFAFARALRARCSGRCSQASSWSSSCSAWCSSAWCSVGVVLGAVSWSVVLGVVVVVGGRPRYVAVRARPPRLRRGAASLRTEAAEAAALPAPEPPELCPVEVSPPVSSSLARLASADCSVAFDCSSVTSALCGSSVGQQLALHDLLALGHVDVRDRSARLEAEVELARGLEVAAAGHRRLDDPALRGGGACRDSPGCRTRVPPRGWRLRSHRRREPPVAYTSQDALVRSVMSLASILVPSP